MLKKSISFILLAAMLLLTGCEEKISNSKEPDSGFSEENGDIVIFSHKPDSLCPIISGNRANLCMLGIVYEGLITLDDRLVPQPCLATDWSVTADGLEWTVTLQNGVLWHNGGEFSAEDVVYTVKQLKKTEASAYAYNVSNIAEVTSASTDRVKFKLKKPCANFMSLMYFPIIKKLNVDVAAVEEFEPDGTGPYFFDKRSEGNTYYLCANANWRGGKQAANMIKVMILPDNDTALYAFSSGSIDIVEPDNMDWGRFADPQSAAYTSVPTPIFNFLGINHANKLLGHSELRTAVSYAIDREWLIDEIMMGYAEAANTPIRKSWLVYGTQSYDHKQNTNAANEILEENGWSLANGVYRKSEDGAELSAEFTIIVNEENTVRQNIAEGLIKNLEEFGIKATVEKLPYKQYAERIENGNYDAFIGSVEFSADLDFSKLFGEGNSFNFSNDEMTLVMNETQNAQAEDELKAAYAKFINLFEQLNPVVGLFFEDDVLIYSKQIKDEDITPSYYDIYRGIENMHKGAS